MDLASSMHKPAGWLGWCLFCYTLTRLGGSCGLCASWKANLMKVFHSNCVVGPTTLGQKGKLCDGLQIETTTLENLD